MRPAPVLRYPGSKWNLAEWIVGHLPRHEVYVEPFFGSGAVFFCKPRAELEVINDREGAVVNLFRVIRDRPGELAAAVTLTPLARDEHGACWSEPVHADPVEWARRFLVRIWQNHGAVVTGKRGWWHATNAYSYVLPVQQWHCIPERVMQAAARLSEAQIENLPALDVITKYRHADCTIYADPPYVTDTRMKQLYAHEMTDEDHSALLDALDAHTGPVVLSGYRCSLYDNRLAHWRRVEREAQADGGRGRVESLWLNRAAAAGLSQMTLPFEVQP